MLLEAGLMRPGDEGRAPYDLFFNRVMFPIRDRRGRVISFGGRILADGQPKYVNGPETPVFSKRRTLYGLDLAREGVRQGRRLVVVEGYMDVIALNQAGQTGAVAPLGTALTEEQLDELWRLSPRPMLCFDADSAGVRAAVRALEIALPHLGAERSISVVGLPSGEDPDSLMSKIGAAGFEKILDTARPPEESLFVLLSAGVSDSVEGRAALTRRLEGLANSVADKPLAWEMRQYFRDKLRGRRASNSPVQSIWRQRPGSRGLPRKVVVLPPRSRPSREEARAETARTLVAILLRHPFLMPTVEEALVSLDLPPPLARLRNAILQWSQTAEVLDSAALMSHLTLSGLGVEVSNALSVAPQPLPACVAVETMPSEAGAGWWHFFELMDPERLDEELKAALEAMEARIDDGTQRRLKLLAAQRKAIQRGEPDETDG